MVTDSHIRHEKLDYLEIGYIAIKRPDGPLAGLVSSYDALSNNRGIASRPTVAVEEKRPK